MSIGDELLGILACWEGDIAVHHGSSIKTDEPKTPQEIENQIKQLFKEHIDIDDTRYANNKWTYPSGIAVTKNLKEWLNDRG